MKISRIAWVVLGALTGCRLGGPATDPLPLPPPGTDGLIHFDANDLYRLYEKDGRRADKALRGKVVAVQGTVVFRFSDIDAKPNDKQKEPPPVPNLFLHVDHKSNGFWVGTGGIICNFAESARPTVRATAKKVGDGGWVTIKGKVGGKLGSVFLEECQFVPTPTER